MCEHCSKLNGKSSKTDFEKYQSILKPRMNLRIFLQILEYNSERYEHCKNKIKVPSHLSIACLFQVNIIK